ncbi:hypothetical protein Ahy_A10g047933 isoform A [Arachis hypogaea]|uniref:Uncharacterized protein n=1 Tax=Arachis hypogaea TaxID=3818 RepID=A0A445B3W2_ARAHY|nr:hypothetical protein Ahy_A10g047933 isoform A [Arachis hypogaea]
MQKHDKEYAVTVNTMQIKASSHKNINLTRGYLNKRDLSYQELEFGRSYICLVVPKQNVKDEFLYLTEDFKNGLEGRIGHVNENEKEHPLSLLCYLFHLLHASPSQFPLTLRFHVLNWHLASAKGSISCDGRNMVFKGKAYLQYAAEPLSQVWKLESSDKFERDSHGYGNTSMMLQELTVTAGCYKPKDTSILCCFIIEGFIIK